jgi:hypothetical protein
MRVLQGKVSGDMTSPAIKLQPASLEVSSRGAVTGVLHFIVDGVGFPDASWNDFVVVVLSWWCATIAKVESGQFIRAQLRFMDGPFAAQLEPAGTGNDLRLQFLQQGSLVNSGTIACDELREQVLAAGKQVLEFCNCVGATGDDVEHLRQGVAALSEC